jgi:Leucine-rich repeat (LRR) protein
MNYRELEYRRVIRKPFILKSVNDIIPEDTQVLKVAYDVKIWPKLPEGLLEIYCSDTKVKDLPKLPSSLQELYCEYCRLEGLPELPPSLEILYCRGNEITSLPISILNCNLQYIEYKTNRIELTNNMNPIIKRFLDRVDNGIYNNTESVHYNSIQESIKQSIMNLLNDKPKEKYNFIEDPDLSPECKQILSQYCELKDVHSTLGVTFEEVLNLVLNRINNHENRSEILKVLEIEMNDSMCKCFTGRISRLVNVLNGFCDDIIVKISDSEQIGSVITSIIAKFPENLRKQEAINNLTSLGYSDEIIRVWTEDL